MPDLLFELRCEELPARDVGAATRAIEAALAEALTAAGLRPSSTSSAWTPRRIAVWAHGVPDRSPDREERVRGPRISAAFDAAGAPTRACEGFARKNGVEPSSLVRDGDSVVAVVRTPGRAAAEVVAEVLPTLPTRAGWKKSMRWGAPVPFARPIRGVVALLDGDVVACEVAGLPSGRETRGHPFLAPGAVPLATASRDAYLAALRSARVLADPGERRRAVLDAAHAVAPDVQPREALLEEVVNLVEWPSALLGSYDARFLELPPRLLVTVMEHHQRFFPVRTADGRLAPRFVAILDRPATSAAVARRGFERVLVPRLHDAAFFFAEDRKRIDTDDPHGAVDPRLRSVTYHRKLGTVEDKVHRLRRLAEFVARELGAAGGACVEDAVRAARLSKNDLVSLLVGEFPELQGHVGGEYARLAGANDRVVEAVQSQYRHEFGPTDALGPAAVALVVAENADTLAQFGMHVGLPTGSADPFGLRRAAITLIEVCERFAPALDLRRVVEHACRVEPRLRDGALVEDASADAGRVLAYLDTRLRQRCRDGGAPPDHIDAVGRWSAVGEFRERIDDLRALAADPAFDRLLEVAERCRNITKKSEAGDGAAVREDLLTEPAERALFRVWRPLRDALPPGRLARADAERMCATVAGPLHTFFDEVFVNADDPAVRANRHALLREIDGALLRFADLCRIVRRTA